MSLETKIIKSYRDEGLSMGRVAKKLDTSSRYVHEVLHKYDVEIRSQKDYYKPLEERFWNKIDEGEPDECWEWQAATDTQGYGRFATDDGLIGAHRFMHQLEVGNIPDGHFVCHTCDNKLCVNPDHLWTGTHTDNLQDMVRKERGPRQKLTEEEARAIKHLYNNTGAYRYEIAECFDVHENTVYHIGTGKTWKHLD